MPSEKRTITVRLDDEQYERARMYARERGMSLAELMLVLFNRFDEDRQSELALGNLDGITFDD